MDNSAGRELNRRNNKGKIDRKLHRARNQIKHKHKQHARTKRQQMPLLVPHGVFTSPIIQNYAYRGQNSRSDVVASVSNPDPDPIAALLERDVDAENDYTAQHPDSPSIGYVQAAARLCTSVNVAGYDQVGQELATAESAAVQVDPQGTSTYKHDNDGWTCKPIITRECALRARGLPSNPHAYTLEPDGYSVPVANLNSGSSIWNPFVGHASVASSRYPPSMMATISYGPVGSADAEYCKSQYGWGGENSSRRPSSSGAFQFLSYFF